MPNPSILFGGADRDRTDDLCVANVSVVLLKSNSVQSSTKDNPLEELVI